MPERRDEEPLGNFRLTASTDNQGNGHVVAKLMTTSFPLNVILMELAEQFALRRTWLNLEWVPRQHNEEADALANGEFGQFSPDRRVHFNPAAQSWLVMSKLLEEGDSMFEEFAAKCVAKAHARKMHAEKRKWRVPKEQPLRVRDPWR